MKTIFICINDWASLAAKFAKSLQVIGEDAESYCLNEHPFFYSLSSKCITLKTIREKINEADVIIYSHGDIALLNQTSDLLKGKKVAVCYTGSAYRKIPEAFNEAFNSIVSLSLTDQTEFMCLGAKNIHYIATAIDTKQIDKFGHEIRRPFTVGHFPSNAEVKGTNDILEMLSRLDVPYNLNYSKEIVSHDMQFKRMNQCDIYIELFKPQLNGKEYGCWGVTAFEAAAAGKVVVTQNINLPVYEEVYGTCPLVVCNSETQFLNEMTNLLDSTMMFISELQTETYNWVKENHSFEATGKYLKSLL